jgi:hypothetical protein
MKQFRTTHIDDVEKIARENKLGDDKYCWHEDDPRTRRITGLAILKVLPELERFSGVHVDVINPNLGRGDDYAFDFRDINGNEILPFFTAKKPLFCGAILYGLLETFPDLRRVHTAKIGICNSETRRVMCKLEKTIFKQFNSLK